MTNNLIQIIEDLYINWSINTIDMYMKKHKDKIVNIIKGLDDGTGTNMEWIPASNPPKEVGKYMCFVPDCKHYNKHWAEYHWDGANFRDDTYMGRNRIVEASHYMIIVEPQESTEVAEKLNQPGVIISTDKLTEYQLEIRTRLREKFNDLQIEIGRGDRLMINGVVITGGVIINDVRNHKDYDNDIRFFSDEIKRQYLDKRKY